MKRFWNAERLACGLALAAAAGAWLAARRFPAGAGAPSGPGTFPVWLSAALAALALLALVRPSRPAAPPSAPAERPDARRLLLMTACSAAYLLALPLTGFISATALFGAALLALLGLRRPARALAAGFLFAFALHGLFERLMNVALPKGWIG